MKFFTLMAFVLFSNLAFANTEDSKTPEITRMICSETCQRWNSFENRCDYRTACTFVDSVVTYKECMRWDSFKETCGDERVVRQYLQFDPSSGSPACTESCQYNNGFGQCIYRTSCTVQPHCASLKYCERWDAFQKTCRSERTDTACNLWR